MKKKQKLCTEKKRLTSANVRLKKSIANQNEKIRIMIDEKEELVRELNMLYSEKEVNDANIETMRDHKNRKAWPLFIVKVIIKILDNGTPPSAIAKNLVSTCMLICPNAKIIELPNIDCIREQRGTLRIATECYAICILAKNPEWRQLWFDGTSRRTVSMLTFAAGIIENNKMRSIITQAAKVGLGESTVNTVEIMKEILDDGREYLERLKETCEREFPDYKHDIPPASSVALVNCQRSVITRRLTMDEILKELNDANDNNEPEHSEGVVQNMKLLCC